MANAIAEVKSDAELVEPPDTSHLITEDDTPVDNLFSAKQQRLLVEPLYSSWAGPGDNRTFLVAANVGVFYAIREPAIVPDVFVALDVTPSEDWWTPAGRSYLVWEHGKAPDIVIEIVSNTRGEELTRKLHLYAWIGVPLYVVFDPDRQIQEERLVIYRINATGYLLAESTWLERLQLGLTVWEGEFEGVRTQWLRWCDQDGNLIPTGQERAVQALARVEQERTRAERLAAQLRALGIEPEA